MLRLKLNHVSKRGPRFELCHVLLWFDTGLFNHKPRRCLRLSQCHCIIPEWYGKIIHMKPLLWQYNQKKKHAYLIGNILYSCFSIPAESPGHVRKIHTCLPWWLHYYSRLSLACSQPAVRLYLSYTVGSTRHFECVRHGGVRQPASRARMRRRNVDRKPSNV